MKIVSQMTITISLFFTILLAVSGPLQAQPDRPRHAVTINTDLVVTWAQITSRNDGTFVKGLVIDDFVLHEDGKQQQISLIYDGQPLSVVILIDGLVPCDDKQPLPPEWSFRRSREALRQFGDDAEIALMVWYTQVALAQPLTRDLNDIAYYLEDRNRLINASRQAGRPGNFTDNPAELPRPGEAVYQAARYLEKAASPGRRKIIVNISTPALVNKTHLHAAAEVSALLERIGATIYGLYQSFDQYRPEYGYSSGSILGIRRQDKKRRAGGTIEEFAEQTGGSILMAKVKFSNPGRQDGDETLIKLAGLIRSSYTIGYYPENSNFDGRFRRTSLELSPSGKAKAGKVNIKTRNGYRALRPSAPAASEAQPER